MIKAIALHGLGLYIYAGEDLPDTGAEETPPTKPKVTKLPSKDRASGGEDLITPAQLKFVQRLIVETDADVNQLLDFFGFESTDTIPKAAVNGVIKALEVKRGRRAA